MRAQAVSLCKITSREETRLGDSQTSPKPDTEADMRYLLTAPSAVPEGSKNFMEARVAWRYSKISMQIAS